MSVTRNILNAEYRLLRAPMRALERRVLPRLPEESVVRMGAEGGLGLMDSVAGRLTGNDDVRRHGAAMIEAVKASIRARWDERRADNLHTRAERERSKLHSSADRKEQQAVRDIAAAVDDTVGEMAQRKTEAAFSAAKTAGEKISDVGRAARQRHEEAEFMAGVEEAERFHRSR